MNDDNQHRPPIGLLPEWRHKELRLQEINEAIGRYLEVNKPIPVNWIAEQYGLICWVDNWKEEKEEATTAASHVSVGEWELRVGGEVSFEMITEKDGVVKTQYVTGKVQNIVHGFKATIYYQIPFTSKYEYKDIPVSELFKPKPYHFSSVKVPLPPPEEKPVLFTTEDGFKATEENLEKVTHLYYLDEWEVVSILGCNWWCREFGGGTKVGRVKEWIPGSKLKDKWFSTEKAARKYVLMNKPCLSVNDVKGMCAYDRSFVGTIWMIQRLKHFVEEKLKK